MNEATSILVACMKSRAAFDKVRPFLTQEDLPPQGQFWWKHIVEWYKRDKGATSIDRQTLENIGKTAIPNPKHEEMLLSYLRNLPDVASSENTARELLILKRHVAGMELAAAIAGSEPAEKIAKLHKRYGDLLQSEALNLSEVRWADDDDAMFELLDRKNKIPIAPRKLNERCGGGAVPGDIILIFGRPEVGKSLFAINMTAGFLRMGKRVLYIENEENENKTKARIITNLVREPWQEVERDKRKYLDLAYSAGLDRLRLGHIHPGSVPEIEGILDEHRADVVVVNQVRNLIVPGLSGGKGLTQKLEQIAIEFRSMVAKYGAVGVQVTQANDRTEHADQNPPLFPGMGDIDSSRTGLPSQADLIVGLGSDQLMRDHNQRAVSLPKNKLGNIHDGFTVEIDTYRSIVR